MRKMATGNRILRFLIFMSYIRFYVHSQPPQPPQAEAGDPLRTRTREMYRYRLINWCIVGQGEHPLYQWPLNQLKPYLLKTYTTPREFQENQFDPDTVPVKEPTNLRLEFNKIQCSETKDFIGDKDGNYIQRVHVKFKSDVHVQGLVIQAVHQPFGLGFPFGQFDVDGEFKCSDCEFGFSKIIGCISRPDVELMHPTVGAFHHKLKKTDKLTGDISEAGPQQELHWNFKWADNTCSSAKVVEFWVLIVLDFDYSVWMVKKFGPYDFSGKPNQITTSTPPINQPIFPSPILSKCNPLPPPFELILASKSPVDEVPRVCFKEYGIQYNASQCWYWREHKIQEYMSKEPDNMKSKITCEVGPKYDLPDHSIDWSPVRVVGDFDSRCIVKFNRERMETKSRVRQPYKVCKAWQGRFFCTGNEDDLSSERLNKEWPKGDENKDRYFPRSGCDPCRVFTEPPLPPPDPPPGFIKRGFHGGMMCFAFFFFLPVSITVCRFYKETLHTREVKGWRIWLLTHVGLAIFVVLLSYISYTLPAFFELDLHMYLGYASLFCCGGGLASGWFRHKTEWVMTLSFYIHSLSGYAGWGLAIGSMIFAPDIKGPARLLCYFASGFSLAAMAILTCHICAVDATVEMKPHRSHIPIIEIRFDDLFPPKHKFRKVFLIVYASVQFLVCCGMLTL